MLPTRSFPHAVSRYSTLDDIMVAQKREGYGDEYRIALSIRQSRHETPITTADGNNFGRHKTEDDMHLSRGCACRAVCHSASPATFPIVGLETRAIAAQWGAWPNSCKCTSHSGASVEIDRSLDTLLPTTHPTPGWVLADVAVLLEDWR